MPDAQPRKDADADQATIAIGLRPGVCCAASVLRPVAFSTH
ncbi:MAG: hypothetical protein ACKPGI_13545 [Verrucomicrobiota bacterium]